MIFTLRIIFDGASFTAFTVTANAIWNNPDPCPYVWGTNNHEIIRNECKLVLKYGNTLKWVKKETK